QPAHPVRGEETAEPLARPDHRFVDRRPGFDLLVGPDLHAGANAGAVPHDAVVTDHAVLLDQRRVLQRHVAADDRLTQPGTLSDVRVRPDDAVAHLRVVI